jgi:hypothetical protein
MSDKIYDSEKNVGDEYTLKTLDHSSPGSVHPVGEAEKQDAVFGTIHADGPDYRAVGWMGTAVLMMKTQVGLGVLSIPAALQTLGMVPGVICLMVIAIMTTCERALKKARDEADGQGRTMWSGRSSGIILKSVSSRALVAERMS